MRILFVTNNYTPYSGGVVSSINTTTEHLIKAGHEVLIVTLDFIQPSQNKMHDPSWVVRIPCPAKFKYKQNHMAIPWAPKKYLAHIIETFKPHLVHVHHPFLLGPIAARIAKKQRIPVLFTYHTHYEKYAHYLPLLPRLTRPFIRYLVSNFCKKVDGIIAPGTSIIRSIEKQNKSIIWLPSGINHTFFNYPEKKLPKNYTVQPFQLLYVGRFAKEKNIHFLLDVLAKLSNKFQLILAGFGAMENELKQYAYHQLKIPEEQIQFVVKPSKETLHSLYAQADLFVFASQSETQGLVIAEAMAHSNPVVALNGPGQEDIIVNTKNGFLVESQQEMINKILLIANDPSLLDQLQQNAWQTAQDYNPEYVTKKLITFYESYL